MNNYKKEKKVIIPAWLAKSDISYLKKRNIQVSPLIRDLVGRYVDKCRRNEKQP